MVSPGGSKEASTPTTTTLITNERHFILFNSRACPLNMFKTFLPFQDMTWELPFATHLSAVAFCDWRLVGEPGVDTEIQATSFKRQRTIIRCCCRLYHKLGRGWYSWGVVRWIHASYGISCTLSTAGYSTISKEIRSFTATCCWGTDIWPDLEHRTLYYKASPWRKKNL
jgi:hypothetical protein